MRRARFIQPSFDGKECLVNFVDSTQLELWNLETFSPTSFEISKPEGSRACAISDNVICISLGNSPGVVGFDKTSGTVLWEQMDVTELMKMRTMNKPELLFCDCGLERLVVLDPITGKILHEEQSFGRCFVGRSCNRIVCHTGREIRLIEWPSFNVISTRKAQSFGMLGVEFAGDRILYAEVEGGLVLVDSTGSRSDKVVDRSGHFTSLGFSTSRQAFLGIDIENAPFRLVVVDCKSGELVEQDLVWPADGEFIDDCTKVLTLKGEVFDVSDSHCIHSGIWKI